MEEENNNNIKYPVPMDLNKKIPPYFLIATIIVLVIGIFAFILFSKDIIPFKFAPVKSPATEEVPLITIKTKAYELTNEKGVQIYLSSNNGSTEISAFQMKFALPKDIKKENIEIKVNPDLESQAWKFPIARFEEEDGSPVIKISGFRLGNSPYVVKGNLLIGTVSTKDGLSVPLTLDLPNTLLYSSDAVTKIPFDTLSE